MPVASSKRKRSTAKAKKSSTTATATTTTTATAGNGSPSKTVIVKKKREQKPLSCVILDSGVKISDKDNFLYETIDGDDPGQVVPVCYAIKCGTATIQIKSLNLDQLRHMCTCFGIRAVGSLNTTACKHRLHEHSQLKHHCENMPNPNASEEQLKVSTLLRLVNACFMPEISSDPFYLAIASFLSSYCYKIQHC